MSDVYYVWQRKPDGYVAASCNTKPQNYQQADGINVSFVHLGTFDKWPDAAIFIRNYYNIHCAFCYAGSTPYWNNAGQLAHEGGVLCQVAFE